MEPGWKGAARSCLRRGRPLTRAGALLLCGALAGCPGPRLLPPDADRADAGLVADGGADAGPGPDAGLDAGFDAGTDGGEDAGPSLRCLPRDAGIPDAAVLRVVAANLSSGNLQSYDPGQGARILQGLKPDVVLIQEWNIGNKSDLDRRAWVNATFGEEFCFQVESGAQLPNGFFTGR